MPKRDDKQSMAEDYLAQVEWENNNNPGNKRGQAPWKNAPNWKYKKVYPKNSGVSSASSNSLGIIVLLALAVVAGYIAFTIFTTSSVGIVAPIIFFVLLVILFLVTRVPKESNPNR